MENLVGLFDPNLEDSESEEFNFDEFNLDEIEFNNNFNENSLPPILPPEEYYGCIEYKRQLIRPSSQRLMHLVTQMQFRLTEGSGECRYLIGVDDDGTMHGLHQSDLDETLKTINQMATQLNAETKVIRRRQCGADLTKWAVELLVRQIPPDRESVQYRVAVLGNVDAGKSTLVGVLTNGELDNGKGKSRLQMFRHPHEITSGRTSSISVDLLRFKTDGPIHGTQVQDTKEATKIVEFWDLAGDMRYMKTTVYGLTSSAPDVVMLVISANKGIQGTTMEQLQIAKALHIPIYVVVTKIDLCSESQIQSQLRNVEKFLGELPFDFLPILIDSDTKVANVSKNFNHSDKIIPIFTTSSVNGHGLNIVTSFLNLLPVKDVDDAAKEGPVEFKIDQFWNLEKPEDGAIIHGRLKQGIIKRSEKLRIGPTDDAKFIDCKVISIKRNDIVTRSIEAGQLSTLKIIFDSSFSIRKGLILVSESNQEKCYFQFLAECLILNSENGASPKRRSIRIGQLVTAHLDNIRQTVRIDEIFKNSKKVKNLNQGEKGNVKFTFIRHPEFIHINSSIVFRDNEMIGSGKVIRVFAINNRPTQIEETKKTRQKLNSL